MLNVVALSVAILGAVMQSAIMPNVGMVSVIMPSVVMPNVAAPWDERAAVCPLSLFQIQSFPLISINILSFRLKFEESLHPVKTRYRPVWSG
jgi:hypothetical protein